MTEDEIARLALFNEAEDSRQSELTDAQAQYAAFCLSLGFDKPEDFDLLYGALQKLRETREPVPLPTPEEMLAQRKAYLETDEGWATIEPSMDVITRMLEIVSEAQLSRPPMNNLDAIQLFRERETELSTTEQKLTMAMLAQELQQLRVILVDEDGLLWNDVLMVGQIQAGGQAPPESEDADADGIPDNPQSLWSRVWGWIAGR